MSAPLRLSLAGALLLTFAPGAAGPLTAGRGATVRVTARATYNDSLKRLFEDLARAKTPDELRAARSRGRKGFSRAVGQDPSYPLPYYNLAVLAEADEDWGTARTYFEQFRKLDGESELSMKAQRRLEYLTRMLETDGRAEGRRSRQYDQALEQVNALVNLGLLPEATATAELAARLDDTRWEAYALIGSALARHRRCADAIGLLQKAVKRAPNDVKPALSKTLGICETSRRG